MWLLSLCFAAEIRVPSGEATVADAMGVAVEGDTIIIEASIDEQVRIDQRLTVIAEPGVVISGPPNTVFVGPDGSESILRGLVVEGPGRCLLSDADDVQVFGLVCRSTQITSAIYVRAGSLTCTDCEMRDVVVPTGGPIQVSGGSLTLVGGLFEDNGGPAGLVFVNAGGAVMLDGVTMRRNTATSTGGALRCIAGTACSVVDSVFDENHAGSNGGAIAVWSDLHVSGSVFTHNTGYDGGAIACVSSTCAVSESRFENNASQLNGGAIHVNSGTLQIDSSAVCGNTAAAQGGAIYLTNSVATMDHLVSSWNQGATFGGSIEATVGSLSLINSTFVGDTVVGGTGAAVSSWNQTEFTFRNNLVVASVGGLPFAITGSPATNAATNLFFDNGVVQPLGPTDQSFDPLLFNPAIGDCSTAAVQPTTGAVVFGEMPELYVGALPPVDEDEDGFAVVEDCDDHEALAAPNGQSDVCDGIDNDCDGAIDENPESPLYFDADGDLFGGDVPAPGCPGVPGTSLLNTDCDDGDPSVNPQALTDGCDGIDTDCDGSIDEDPDIPWFLDGDGDGVGAGSPLIACEMPAEHVAIGGDCDDDDPQVGPEQVEICNGVDDDCSGGIDDLPLQFWFIDEDGDGYGGQPGVEASCPPDAQHVAEAGDCDDSDPEVHPGAPDLCNGVDEDCTGGEPPECVASSSTASSTGCACDQGGVGGAWVLLGLLWVRRSRPTK